MLPTFINTQIYNEAKPTRRRIRNNLNGVYWRFTERRNRCDVYEHLSGSKNRVYGVARGPAAWRPLTRGAIWWRAEECAVLAARWMDESLLGEIKKTL